MQQVQRNEEGLFWSDMYQAWNPNPNGFHAEDVKIEVAHVPPGIFAGNTFVQVRGRFFEEGGMERVAFISPLFWLEAPDVDHPYGECEECTHVYCEETGTQEGWLKWKQS